MADVQQQGPDAALDEFIDDVAVADDDSAPSEADVPPLAFEPPVDEESDGGVEGGPTFWESDSEDSSNERAVWGPTPFIHGRGRTPYAEEDYDFGWKASLPAPWYRRGFRGGSVSFPAGASDWAPPDTPTQVENVADIQSDIAEDGRLDGSANRLPATSLDIFTYVLSEIVPRPSELPLQAFFQPGGRGAEAVATLTSIMSTCSLWHDTTASMSAVVWGPLVSAVQDEDGWHIAMGRAGDAKVRLVYRWGVPRELVDAEIERASAIYAGRDCEWRHFGRILSNKNLSAVEVLYLRPNARRMPQTALRIYGPLDMLSLRIYVSTSPIIVNAPLLQYLGLLYHTLEQITSILLNLKKVTLSWLFINKPREGG
ncbi:unnamed protein product [Peniophora sp. CBMAI 1063]|nr:unnamed protein product [Peniophora sp. CBMAI 1063]